MSAEVMVIIGVYFLKYFLVVIVCNCSFMVFHKLFNVFALKAYFVVSFSPLIFRECSISLERASSRCSTGQSFDILSCFFCHRICILHDLRFVVLVELPSLFRVLILFRYGFLSRSHVLGSVGEEFGRSCFAFGGDCRFAKLSSSRTMS